MPSQFLQAAPVLGPLLANADRVRPMWLETAQYQVAALG